jgi:hypothetical protein
MNQNKLELDLYLGMAKQRTKYQMNIWKHEGKLCGKLRICDIFLSSRAITLWKIDGSKPNSNLICILVWQSNVPNIKWKCGKLIYRTDRQIDGRTECKPKVPSDFVGRGLMNFLKYDIELATTQSLVQDVVIERAIF